MYRLTTPTFPVRINSGKIEACQCNVYGTFKQGGKALTLEALNVSSDVENNETTMHFNLTQLQSGGFRPGIVHIQVNLIDWMGYRAATNPVQRYFYGNLQEEVLEHVG